MEAMLKAGIPIADVINHFMKNGKTQEEEDAKKKAQFMKKMTEALHDENLSKEQKLDILRSELGADAQAKMEEMLRSGMSIQEVLEHFMQAGNIDDPEESEFAKQMHKLL